MDKPNAVQDRAPRVPSFGWGHPGDRALDRERPGRNVQGDFQDRLGRNHAGETQQEASSTAITCPSLDGQPIIPHGPTCYWDLEREADLGVPHQTLGEEQLLECRELIGSALSEGDPMKDAASRRI
jgi:hypothetical protein